jgi:hypothetical protein
VSYTDHSRVPFGPTLADVLPAIETALTLSKVERLNMVSAVRTIARLLGRAAEHRTGRMLTGAVSKGRTDGSACAAHPHRLHIEETTPVGSADRITGQSNPMRGLDEPPYCGSIENALTYRPHAAISALVCAASSSGVLLKAS